jgi:hypothetical protein
MSEQVSQSYCIHECVCNKYIDYTNTGATPNRVCNGETWCFKKCPHDTRTDSNFPKEIPSATQVNAVLDAVKGKINRTSLVGFDKYGYRKWIISERLRRNTKQEGDGK